MGPQLQCESAKLLHNLMAPQLTTFSLTSNTLSSPSHPCELYISTQSQGDLWSCSQFLQQWSKVTFIMSLLSDKASAWAVAISSCNSPVCQSLQCFMTEMPTVFNHPEVKRRNQFLSCCRGSFPVVQYKTVFCAELCNAPCLAQMLWVFDVAINFLGVGVVFGYIKGLT